MLGLACDARSDEVEALATGMRLHPRLRLHRTVDALVADPAFGATPTILVAAGMPGTAAAQLAARRGSGEPGEVLLLADDPLDGIAVRDADAAMPDGRLRMRPVTAAGMGTRAILSGPAPLDRVLRVGPAGGVPILVAGRAGTLAAQLVLDLLRQLQLPGLTAEVTLAGTGMDVLLARMRQAMPELDQCGHVTAQARVAAGARPALIFALADAPDDGTLRALDPSGLAPILHLARPSWEEVGRALLDPAADSAARRVHGLHVDERRAPGLDQEDLPSLRPWETLPERFREASRLQAAQVPLMLRWAGARLGRTGAAPFTWTAAELTALAEAEHDRWAACMRLEGWRHGAERDDGTKRSPFLVPFAALAAATRDLDTLPVRAAGAAASRDVVVAVGGDAQPSPGFARSTARTLDALRARFTGCLVLRLEDATVLMAALADAAGSAGIPVQLALPNEPDGPVPPVLAAAERVAVGAARRHLPGVTQRLRMSADGQLSDSSC